MKRVAALLLVVAAGCASGRSSRHVRPEVQAPPEAWAGVARIAVLPPDNWTSNVGLEYIAWYRALIGELLREKGYRITPLVEINRFMRKNRFNMAGELGMYKTEELARVFDAQALFTWDIVGDAPNLQVTLVKADGTQLWVSGEVRLDLKYNAVTHGQYAQEDRGIALALGETLRNFPVKP